MRFSVFPGVCGLLLTALCLATLSGCRQSIAPSPTSSARASARLPLGVPAVQHSAEYRKARAHYRRGDYAGALRVLNALRSAPGLAADEQDFLRRQQSLCRAALSPQSEPAPASPAPPVAKPFSADCGPRALLLACQQMGVSAQLASLREASGMTGSGTSLAGLAKAAKAVGLKATGVQMDTNALANLSPPAIAWVDGNHFVAVLAVHGETATIHDPNQERKEDIPLPALLSRTGGVLLTLARHPAR